MNVPGTGGAAATTLDGYQMTRNGEASKALAQCFMASVLGGLISSVVTLFELPALSQFSYHIHSVEMVVIILFGLALIASNTAADILTGLMARDLWLLRGSMDDVLISATPQATLV